MLYEIDFDDGNKKLLETSDLKLMLEYLYADTPYTSKNIVTIKKREEK